ncbi:MAG: arsenate reductase (glutaredoxin) [Polyangiaceae bacterium]
MRKALTHRYNPPALTAWTTLAMITLYHNPRCSKSREALALLEAQGQAPRIVRYLETPPDAATLKSLLKSLGISARELLRSKEPEYTELGLDDSKLSETKLIAAMVAHPRLIERPIAVDGKRAVIGRPPEKVLELLK